MNRRNAPTLLIILVLLASVATLEYRHGRATAAEVAEAIRERLENGDPQSARARNDRVAEQLLAFYRSRGYEPAWTRSGAARELLEVLERAASEGLEPEEYGAERLREVFANAHREGTPGLLAEADLELAVAFLRYGSDVFDGRVDPTALPGEWRTRPRRADLPELLAEATGRSRMRATLASLPPRHDA